MSLDWSQFETELARREGTAIDFQERRVELTSTELAKFILLKTGLAMQPDLGRFASTRCT